MKTKFISIGMVLLCTLFLRIDSFGQMRHPGPRATCPICNAMMIEALFASPAEFSALSREKKITLIKERCPAASPKKVLGVLNNWDRLDLNKITIDRDGSFGTYVIQFGDGTNRKFYTVKSTVNDWELSSNSVADILNAVNEKNQQQSAVYLLVDNIYSEPSVRFLNNVELFNAKNGTEKIRGIGCDIWIDNFGKQKRIGTTVLEPGAVIGKISEITPYVGRSKSIYKHTASVNFSVNGKEIKVSVFGKTMKALRNFLDNILAVFSNTPESSVARGVNRSRILSGADIVVVFKEMGLTQFVQRPIYLKGSFKSSDQLLLYAKRNVDQKKSTLQYRSTQPSGN